MHETFPGGRGSNQAVIATRLGDEVTIIGCVGNDALRREMQDMLVSEGINCSHLHVHQQSATGVELIQVDDHGQNSIAVASGVNFYLTIESSLSAKARGRPCVKTV